MVASPPKQVDPAMTDNPVQAKTVKVNSDLPLRAASALVMALAILAATWIGGWPFRVIWALVAGLVAYEWLTIIRAGRNIAHGSAVAVAVIGIAAGVLPLMAIAIMWLSATLLVWLISARNMLAAGGIAYAGVIALAPAALRDMPQIGIWLIIWSFAVVWFSDIVAYFTGRAFGGPKLMPSVSPKKTWSGALGGLMAGIVGGLGVWWTAKQSGVPVPTGFWLAALISCVATMMGQAGDLAESALKRAWNVKDSSQIIPGHGGFMDRLDAYWAVMALAGAILLATR
jgi:phosphatidate cytidylyltransferase